MTKTIALDHSGVDRSGFAPDSLFVDASAEAVNHQTYKSRECTADSTPVKSDEMGKHGRDVDRCAREMLLQSWRQLCGVTANCAGQFAVGGV